jgi:hypothetical protein
MRLGGLLQAQLTFMEMKTLVSRFGLADLATSLASVIAQPEVGTHDD